MANYRKIYEQHYGVKIPKGYHIHHKDMNHTNDDPLNLEMLTPDEHAQKHGFLSNFLMAQAKACELARPRSAIANKGNQYARGSKHPHTEVYKIAHAKIMIGNQNGKGPHKRGWKWTQPLGTCNCCGKTGGLATMKRWHFDRCSKSSNS